MLLSYARPRPGPRVSRRLWGAPRSAVGRRPVEGTPTPTMFQAALWRGDLPDPFFGLDARFGCWHPGLVAAALVELEDRPGFRAWSTPARLATRSSTPSQPGTGAASFWLLVGWIAPMLPLTACVVTLYFTRLLVARRFASAFVVAVGGSSPMWRGGPPGAGGPLSGWRSPRAGAAAPGAVLPAGRCGPRRGGRPGPRSEPAARPRRPRGSCSAPAPNPTRHLMPSASA